MTLKLPPPPFLTGELQPLNRWLLEIQNIFNSGGLIEPDQIDGLPALITQVAQNSFSIATLFVSVQQNTDDIAANAVATAANAAAIAALAIRVTALEARNQILNGAGAPAGALGVNGDLYINNIGIPGTFLYGKIGGTWQAFA